MLRILILVGLTYFGARVYGLIFPKPRYHEIIIDSSSTGSSCCRIPFVFKVNVITVVNRPVA